MLADVDIILAHKRADFFFERFNWGAAFAMVQGYPPKDDKKATCRLKKRSKKNISDGHVQLG